MNYCPHCGKPLTAYELPPIFGTPPKTVYIQCVCEAERRAADREAERLAYVEKLRLGSGMPAEQRGCRFENFSPDSGLNAELCACRAYAEDFEAYQKRGQGILFTGSTGSGKTHLAAAVANALIDRSVWVRFVPVSELLRELKATYDNRDRDEGSVLDPYKRCGLLILDDLGTESPSEWTARMLHDLIDCRYSGLRPTLITTNLTLGELPKYLSPRTLDRVLDANKPRYIRLNLAAGSYRRREAALIE